MARQSQKTKFKTETQIQPFIELNKEASDLQGMLGKLQNYQMELELQNHNLKEAHQHLEESRNLYADLYDFAPIGYATIDQFGSIKEINLTGSQLLGKERMQLINKPLVLYVAKDYVELFLAYLTKCRQTCQKVITELCFAPEEDELVYVQLISVPFQFNYTKLYRIAIIDISERKQMEKSRNRLLKQLVMVQEEEHLKGTS